MATLPALPRLATLPRLGQLRPVEELPPQPAGPVQLTPTELLGEESPGMLATIGDVLDRPANALRGVLAGRPGALTGLVPFSESMGLFTDEDRVSGQDLLTEWGMIDKPADSILSAEGAAGLGVEMALDPLNLVGIGLLTKGGKAAKAVQGTLQATRKLAAEARAARAAGNLAKAEKITNRLREIGQGIRTGSTATGQAFKEARRLGGGKLPTLGKTWAEQAEKGQRALLSIGGDTSLLPFAPSIKLPEAVAIKGAPVIQKIAETGQWIKNAPMVKPVAQLFSKTPVGVDPESARIIKEEMDAAKISAEAGAERAAAEAGQLDVALRRLQPVEAIPQGSAARIGGELVDPETGEVLAGAGQLAEAQKIQADAVEFAQAMRARAEAAEQALKDARQAPVAPPVATVEGPRVETPRAPALPTEATPAPIAPPPPPPAVDPVQAMSERLSAQRAKIIGDRSIQVGSTVMYTPKGFRKPGKARVTAITPDGRVAVEWTRTGTEKAGKYGKKSVPRKGADIVEPVEVELPRQKQAQVRRRQQDAELANLPQDVRRSVRGQAADAGTVSDAVHVEELERAAVMEPDAMVAGKLKTQRRNEFVEMIGEGPDAVQRAAVFPKTLEKALSQVPVENLPPLKTVEFKPHAVEAPMASEALEEGDKFRLAGDTFTVKELTPAGKVRVKDGMELHFPPNGIPVDRGAPIVKARRPVEDLPPIPKAEPVEALPALKAKPAPAPVPVKAPPPAAVAAAVPPPAAIQQPPTPPPAKLGRAKAALAAGEGKVGVQPFKKQIPNLEYDREQFRMDVQRQFKLKDAEADAVVAITDARAQTWAKSSGKPPERWYAERLAAVRRGSAGELIAQGVPEELAQRARGATEWYTDGRAVIKALKGGKVDTVLHELGHVFRKELGGADLDAVEQAFSVGGKWTRESEERFAQSFERYLQSGQAPTKELSGVFEQFKTWLANIWKALRNKPDIEVSPEVRAVFDRMLGKVDDAGEAVAKGVPAPKASTIEMEQDLLGQTVVSDSARAKLAAKGDQGELFPVELTKEEARARKVAKAHDEAGGGQLFQTVYHGGPERVDTPDLGKVGKRDAGLYGKGFYVAKAQQTAELYGPKVTTYDLSDNAKVLDVGTIHPEYEIPVNQSVQAEIEAAYRKRLQETGSARVKSNPELLEHYIAMIRPKSGTFDLHSWIAEVNRYAETNGFDAVKFSNSEIIVKNPAVLRTMPEQLFQTAPRAAEGIAGRGVAEARPVEEAIPGAVPTPAGKSLPPADLSRSDIERRARLAQKAVNDLSERLKRIPVEETGGPTHQSMMEAQRAASRELAYYSEWARAGRRPPLGPHPTAAAVDRATAAARQGESIRQDVGLSNYLTRAGVGTAKAAEEAAKLLPKDAAPDVHRAVTEALELGEKHGRPPAEVAEVAEAVKTQYAEMLKAEQQWAVPTPALKDPRLHYTTRVATKGGRSFFRGLKPEGRAALFMQLEQARRARGLEPAGAATADYVSQTMERAARSPKGAEVRSLPIPEAKRGWAERQLRSLPPEVQAFVKQNGLEREYLAFETVASTMHESQIARLPAYEGLSIPELNEVFRKAGAKGEVFNENPAAQLFTRRVRHERAKAANAMFENLGRKVGQELPQEVTDWAEATGDGLEMFTTPGTGGEPLGYGIKEVNDIRRQRGMRPIVFDDRNTAAAVQKAMTKLLEPEEVQPLLEWWDKATRTMKSWVTKAFPAYHVRNRMSNRVQSWLEDVPVAGEHYKVANRVLAGSDTTFTTGAGEVLTRDEILDEAQNAGVLRGGFFESEFKSELFKKPSWNVLDAENRFVKTGEKIGAALTAAPGQVLSGAGVSRLPQMNANAVESIDRLGHYLFKRAQGFSPDQASKSVKKALFDYGDLNDFEKNVLGRGMFFYAYSRNVIPFMLDRAVRRPGKVAALARVGGGAGGREGLPENMPAWAREGLPIPLGQDAAGNPMIAYGLGTPLEAAVEPFAGFTEGFQRGAEKGLSMLNPFARMPLEMATGKRFFLGQNIEEARKAPAWAGLLPVEVQKAMGVRQVPMKSGGVRLEMDPYDLYALENSPFGRLSNTIGKAVDTRKPGVARALNIATGAKVVSVDEEREAYLAVKRAKEKLLKELERRGLVQEMQDLYRVTEEGRQSPQAAGLRQLVKR
jgi:hypothetical protein